MNNKIQIEVAYALPEEQFLFTEEIAQGSTVAQALADSKLLKEFPNLNIDKVGIFAKLVDSNTILRPGDRIEVYRPLKVDPRDRRREKVEKERKEAK
ncbi:RnfH family protein [Thiomicrorhabdus arctica]|uniref:RnfH family protein n=1 Tax=Thiomicrorhabdus arctica TaxID=131540 RepID=UPI00036B1C6C|nr:RnfH family protein [Thiomicrorhabdus arctica]